MAASTGYGEANMALETEKDQPSNIVVPST